MCTLSAILLALIGGINKYGFFVGVALLGIDNYLSHSIKVSADNKIKNYKKARAQQNLY